MELYGDKLQNVAQKGARPIYKMSYEPLYSAMIRQEKEAQKLLPPSQKAQLLLEAPKKQSALLPF